MSSRMPVLFIGHGSPMNAIADNSYTKMLEKLAQRIPTPKAILVISAHWMTDGTFVTRANPPKTIHDFYGFPQELFAIEYSAPGSPSIANLIQASVPGVQPDQTWGLDHGAWSVLRHLYPKADIPCLQLSLSVEEPAEYHFNIGKQLSVLRDHDVLILGSGNIVHNLRQIRWDEKAEPYPWAVDFDQQVKVAIEGRDLNTLLKQPTKTQSGRMSVPTPEHFQPLYYILGAASSADALKFEFEEVQNGSIAMRSFSFGLAQ